MYCLNFLIDQFDNAVNALMTESKHYIMLCQQKAYFECQGFKQKSLWPTVEILEISIKESCSPFAVCSGPRRAVGTVASPRS